MGKINKHEKVKLIVGLIGRESLFGKAQLKLSAKFGIVDYASVILDFNFTDYYAKEMGKDLKRQFLSFRRLISPEYLPGIKRCTNVLENKFFSKQGKRLVNIDPGYLNLSKLVLATTKDHQHRLYLGKGIFGEVTLRYKGKSFSSWDWTYPDYRSRAYIEVFNHIRNNIFKARMTKNAE